MIVALPPTTVEGAKEHKKVLRQSLKAVLLHYASAFQLKEFSKLIETAIPLYRGSNTHTCITAVHHWLCPLMLMRKQCFG